MISYTSNVENKTQAIYYSKKPKKSLYYTIEPNDDKISNSSETKAKHQKGLREKSECKVSCINVLKEGCL